jgi:predicted permease
VKRSLRSWLWRVPLDQEVEEELAFHVEMRTRELIARGIDPATARDMATRRLGDVADLKRTCVDLGRKRDRDMRLAQWLEELQHDVKFALRQLGRSPAFSAVAVLTLALGIGANSAIFALVDATLLRPLPLPDPDRVVMLLEHTPTNARGPVSPANMLDWSARGRTLSVIGGFVPGVGSMVMTGADGLAETVPRQWVSARFFDALGATPIVGRTFNDDDNARRASVVVFTESFWRSRFNGDPSVVGQPVRLDGMPFTLVGVVEDRYQLLGKTSMWALLPIAPVPQLRGSYMFRAIGRMNPGVTIEAARSDLAAVAGSLAQEFPKTNQGRGITIDPLHERLIGRELRVTSLLFVGVVGFVLLICCANVANLLLARATVRTRELAIRSALGAGRRRVVRQLLTESLVLAAIGGLLGAGVGIAILGAAPALIPEGLLPAAMTLTFDLRVATFSAAAALLVGVLFGLAPAWQSTDFAAAQALAAESRGTSSRGGWLRNALVTAEVATAVVLLFGAGLLLRSLLAVDAVDRGYGTDNVLTMYVDPLGSRYPTPATLQQFFDEVEREITAAPGVRRVAWAGTIPLRGGEVDRWTFEVVGEPPADPNQPPTAEYQIVSPAYFDTIDLPIVSGRSFELQDTRDRVPICIVNEAFVRAHLPGRNPIGARVAMRPARSPTAQPAIREIVGVARQVKGRPDETQDLLQIYVPMAQNLIDDMYLLVRPESQPALSLATPVRAAIGRVDKDQLVSIADIMTLADVDWETTSRYRFRAAMVITFAVLALVLAMVGVFGILAYSVQQRVRDIGVRRTLGATTHNVLGLVVGNALRVVAAGLVVGLVLSIAAGRLLAAVLFGVEPLDLVTFVTVTVLLLLTAALSTAGPAWRAARIDPAAALRSQ